MQAAIAQLAIALEVVETNEPIHRAEGNIEQADLAAANAADYRQALAVLEAASKLQPMQPSDLSAVLGQRTP